MRRDPDQLARRLARVAWLAPLGPDALLALARAGRVRELERGETLWRRGEQTDAVGMVLAGRLDVVRDTARGDRMLLRPLGPDEVVGLSTIGGAPHSADLVAGEAGAVLVLPGDALRAAVARDPRLALGALAHLGELVARLTEELEELRTLPVAERVLSVLRRRAAGLVEIRATHEELAQQVGATRENVSRALAALERAGAVRCRRGRIEIRDLARPLRSGQ